MGLHVRDRADSGAPQTGRSRWQRAADGKIAAHAAGPNVGTRARGPRGLPGRQRVGAQLGVCALDQQGASRRGSTARGRSELALGNADVARSTQSTGNSERSLVRSGRWDLNRQAASRRGSMAREQRELAPDNGIVVRLTQTTANSEMSLIRSGKWDLNPRHRPWQGRALPLSYSRVVRCSLARSRPSKRVAGYPNHAPCQAPAGPARLSVASRRSCRPSPSGSGRA